MKDYGSILGRLVCMYLQSIDEESGFEVEHSLTEAQLQRLMDLKEGLNQDEGIDDELDMRFHDFLKALFFWHESHRLMESLECPVQQFLVYASVEKGAKGFINVREIGRLIAKLVYGIRACIFNELIIRCKDDMGGHNMNAELGGLMTYARGLLQTPFGFLLETMHFAASVSGEAGSLPQVSWLGIESGIALAIHGKRVELQQLRDLCTSMLKETRAQLDYKIKMGIAGSAKMDWLKFEPEDDLTNIRDGYSFVSSPNSGLSKDKPGLLHGFMANEVTKSFFTRGINGRVVLWRRSQCLEWLGRCRKLLEMLAVLCHILGGQPARGTELATLRWRNGVDEQRGVYWVNGTIMLLAMYSKMRSITRKNKLIPR
jgi:hypothetical protein